MHRNFELEKKLAQMGVEMTRLRDQIRAKDELIENSSAVVDQSNGQYKRLESSLSNVRESVGQYEIRISQLEKAIADRDETISKMHVKLKDKKSALKKTQEALLGQENVVMGLEKKIEESVIRQDDRNACALEITNLKKQLFDANQLLENNAQIISFLNKKVSDQSMFGIMAPVGYSRASPGINTPTIPHDISSSVLSTTTTVNAAASSSVSRSGGPVKFTARLGATKPLIKH